MIDWQEIVRRNRGEIIPAQQEERSKTTGEENTSQERPLKTISGRVVHKPSWLNDYDTTVKPR